MSKKFFKAPVVLLTGTGGIGDGEPGIEDGMYTGQGPLGMTFDEWYADIISTYGEDEELLLEMFDYDGSGTIDESDFEYWLENFA